MREPYRKNFGTSPISPGREDSYGSGIYFVKVFEYVKIGFTSDFKTRLDTISRAMPITPEVLAFVDGPRSIETTIHRQLRDLCLKNEWYADCPMVRAVLADAVAGKIAATGRDDAGAVRELPASVLWASRALQKLAEPVERNEHLRVIVQRAASLAGLSYWRTFDLWYAKARQLEEQERVSILAALEASNG
jgi:hypothetical protein